MLFPCNKYSNLSLDFSMKQLLLLVWISTSLLRELVHLERDFYLLTVESAQVRKDRICRVQNIFLLCCPTFLYIPLEGYFLQRQRTYLFYFCQHVYFLPVFFSQVLAHSAVSVLFLLTLEEELDIRLMRLKITRKKHPNILFTI